MEFVEKYKKRIAGRYVPVDSEQIGLKIIESDTYHVSVKYDGHFGILAVSGNQASLYDRSGNELKIKSITDAALQSKKSFILAGEICAFVSGQPKSHHEVSSFLKDPSKYDLRFAAFDLLEYEGKEPEGDFDSKYQSLKKLANTEVLFTVEQNIFSSRKDISSFFNQHADKEGIVVRASNGIIYKVKKIINLDLVLMGYGESTGEQDRMREMLLGFALGDDNYQIVTRCGGGFTDKDRIEIPKMLKDAVVESEFTEVSGAKTAFIMVKPEHIVEISCLDLINETTEGPIKKAILKFDKEKGWLHEKQEATLSILSPNFIRFRKDKKVNSQDAGTAQAYSLIEPLSEKVHNDIEIPSSIIRREVYTKKGKDGTAVRKFIGLKTNKEKTGLYPPFLIIYTDLSTGRKTPLEQEVFICQNEEELSSKFTELKDENIKKGWSPA